MLKAFANKILASYIFENEKEIFQRIRPHSQIYKNINLIINTKWEIQQLAVFQLIIRKPLRDLPQRMVENVVVPKEEINKSTRL